VDETTPARYSRRGLLAGAAGVALSAILSACTVNTATETPTRTTPTPLGAAPSPTRAGTPTGAGATGATGAAPTVAAPTASAGATRAASPAGIAGIPPTGVANVTSVPGTPRPAATGAGGMGTAPAPAAAPVSTPAPALPPVAATARPAGMPAPPMGGDIPDPEDFNLVSARAMGTPTGANAPADLNGRLSLPRLVVSLPISDDPQRMLADHRELLAYLRTAFAIDVIGVAGRDYTSIVDAMAQRAVDVAFLTPVAYALAYRDAGANPILHGETPNGGNIVQQTLILVPAESTARTLADLRGRTIAVVDGDPLLGHWVAQAALLDKGRLTEGTDYTDNPFGTHIDSYGAVVDMRADAGVMLAEVYQVAAMVGTVEPARVRILDTSPNIPNNLLAVRSDITPADRELLTLAFLTLNDQPRMAPALRTFLLSPPDGTGQFGPGTVKLRRTDDGAYAELRGALDRIGLDLRDSTYKGMQENARSANPYNTPVTMPMPSAAMPAAAMGTARPAGAAAATARPAATASGTATATARPANTPAGTARPATGATASATARPANTAAPPNNTATATARPAGTVTVTARPANVVAVAPTTPPTVQPTARPAAAPTMMAAAATATAIPAAPAAPTATARPANTPTAPAPTATAPPSVLAPVSMSMPAPLALPGSFVTATASTMISGVNPPTDLMGKLGLRRLVVALMPSEDPNRTLADNADLLAYLRVAFGVEVIGAANRSGTAILDAFRNRQVDIALMSNYAYVLARANANGVPLIQGEGPDGRVATHNSLLISRADSTFGGPRDLARTVLGFMETDPVVGRIVPTYQLMERGGLMDGRDYRVTSIGTHADAYQAVIDGVVDAAAIASDVYAAGVDARTFDGAAIKILDTSPPIAQGAVVIRNDIAVGDADLLALAFLTINDQQRSSRLFTSVVQPGPRGKGAFGLTTVKLRRGDDASYNELRNAVMRTNFNLQGLLR